MDYGSVRLTKCQNVETQGTPDGWVVEGLLFAPLEIGGGATILRTSHNGVPCGGMFQSSAILDYDEVAGFFMATDGVFHIEWIAKEASK